MKIKDHLQNIQKKKIIYVVLLAIFVVLLILYLYSRFVPDNVIQRLFRVSDHADYVAFLSAYIDSFFIYAASAIAVLWVLNIILHAIREKISPDIHNTLHVLVRVIVIPFFVIAYLNKFDAYSGAIIGVAATVGGAFGIAFALSINELVTGLYMVFSKHHNVGDYILLPNLGIEGMVNEISIINMTIKQPDDTTAIIPNKKLREEEIINIKVTKVEKERNGLTDFILYGRRVEETHYVYPLEWSANSDDSHKDCVAAIDKTSKQFKDFIEEEVTWRILDRDRWHRKYQLEFVVLDPKKLLSLSSDFKKSLESNYEEITKKKK